MTHEHYDKVATIIGNTYYNSDKEGKANIRKHIGEIISYLEKSDENFKANRFCYQMEVASLGGRQTANN